MAAQITLVLPEPPSVNDLWGYAQGRVYRKKKYVAWLKEAGLIWLTQKPRSPIKSLPGEYALIIAVSRATKCDIDNLVKAISDMLEGVGIIQNDKLCTKLLVVKTDSPTRCVSIKVRPTTSSRLSGPKTCG